MAHWSELCQPMPVYRGPEGEDSAVAARARFYAACSRVFGWGWRLEQPEPAPLGKVGRDGRLHDRQKYGEAGIHSYRDQASDAMTWLVLKKHLNSRVDWPRTEEKLQAAWADGNERHATAQELELLFEKAELTPLRSPDFAAAPSGGFGSRYVGVSKVVAQMKVQDLRREMPPALMQLLERILLKNEMVWHGLKGKARDGAIDNIRLALDFAGWALFKVAAGQAGSAAVEARRLALCRKWPAADQFFYQQQLRPAMHAGKVISRSKRKAGDPVE